MLLNHGLEHKTEHVHASAITPAQELPRAASKFGNELPPASACAYMPAMDRGIELKVGLPSARLVQRRIPLRPQRRVPIRPDIDGERSTPN